MAWYAFKGYNNNQPINASAFDGSILNALGMHGYPTAAQAKAKPNSVGWWQIVSVNAAIDDANNARDVASAPGNAAKAAANAVTGGLPAIGDFFHRLSQKATWERVGEIALGALLLYVGLKAITTPSGQNPARQTIKDTAGTITRKVIKRH